MAIKRCPQEWSEWVTWLAAGLHGRCRWRLPVLLLGILFARGRRTVSSWLRAANIGRGFSTYYYFIARVGRKRETVSRRLLLLLLRRLTIGPRVLFALDDTPTRRYGLKVQGAGLHHNPTSGPTDIKFLYGHVWVTLAWVVRHPLWGTIAFPLLANLYIRQGDVAKLPKKLAWSFQTKFQLAVWMIEWVAEILRKAGKNLWIVADGFYATRRLIKPMRKSGVVLVSRLRKDACLWSLPPKLCRRKRRCRGQPLKYGRHHFSLAKRAAACRGWQTVECVQYGKKVFKKYKTFLATYRPAYGLIRVVIVQESEGPQFFFCTQGDARIEDILEALSDRSAIEQDFHDLKEVWGIGQQQVRYLWANIGAFHLNLWMHTLLELWAWNKPKNEICDRRESPWDAPARRPSHADRRKALRRIILQHEYLATHNNHLKIYKNKTFIQWLIKLVS
jgi:DDE superfamily endonuclease